MEVPEGKGKGKKGKGKKSVRAAIKKTDSADNGLHATIKEMQKTDPEARLQWIAYVTEHGEGNRDPARHDDDFIQAFLDQYESGERMEVPECEGKKGRGKKCPRDGPCKWCEMGECWDHQ